MMRMRILMQRLTRILMQILMRIRVSTRIHIFLLIRLMDMAHGSNSNNSNHSDKSNKINTSNPSKKSHRSDMSNTMYLMNEHSNGTYNGNEVRVTPTIAKLIMMTVIIVTTVCPNMICVSSCSPAQIYCYRLRCIRTGKATTLVPFV